MKFLVILFAFTTMIWFANLILSISAGNFQAICGNTGAVLGWGLLTFKGIIEQRDNQPCELTFTIRSL